MTIQKARKAKASAQKKITAKPQKGGVKKAVPKKKATKVAKKTPVKKEKTPQKKSATKAPVKKPVPKKKDNITKPKRKKRLVKKVAHGPIKCKIQTTFNLMNVGYSYIAMFEKPNLNNLRKRAELNEKHELVKLYNNLLTKNCVSPGENTRWKQIAQVQGSTRQVSVMTVPPFLKLLMLTAVYNMTGMLYISRGIKKNEASPNDKKEESSTKNPLSRVIYVEDIILLFEELIPSLYEVTHILPDVEEEEEKEKKKRKRTDSENNEESSEQKPAKKAKTEPANDKAQPKKGKAVKKSE